MNKEHIVKKNIEFTNIIKKVKPINSKYSYVFFVHGKSNYRFGISVSTKIGNAVMRNRIRRRVKEILRKYSYTPDFDCIIIIKKTVHKASFEELESDIIKVFKKQNKIMEDKSEV